MIRINLLGGERQVKKKVVAFDIGQRLTLACSPDSRRRRWRHRVLVLVAAAALGAG
jgi:2-methylcitrate dehydratase PrpD